MKEQWRRQYAQYFGNRRLNLGAGAMLLDGWDNHDLYMRPGIQLCGDLNSAILDFWPPDYYDCILASHVLEHIDRSNLLRVMRSLWSALKIGGHLIAICPYGASDAAWENPHHRQFFTERTWGYFLPETYQSRGHSGEGADEGEPIMPWRIVEQHLVPYGPEENPVPGFHLMSDSDKERAMRLYRNVIQETHCVFQKVVPDAHP